MKLSPLLLLVSAPYTGAMPAPDDPTIAGGMPAMGAAMPAPVAGMPAPEGAAQVGGRGDGFQLEPECVDICPKDREPAMSARCDFAAVGSCLCPTAADVYCAWTCNQEGNQWGIICGGGRLPDPPPESATATADPTTNETVDKDDECADVCPIGSAFGVSCDPAAVGSCPCPHSDEGCSWDCLSAGNGEGMWQMRCGGISGGGMPEPVPSSEPEPETNPDPKPSDCAEACPARFPDLFSPCDSETVGSCECDSRPGCFFKCQEVSGKRSDWVEICYGTIAGSEPEVSQVFERDPVQPVVGNDGCFCPAEVPRPFSSCDLNAVEGCRCPYSDQRLRSASCAFMCLPAGSTGSWFQICGEGGPTQEEGAKPSPSPAPTAHLKGSTAALETSASFAPVPLGSVLAIALVGLVLV